MAEQLTVGEVLKEAVQREINAQKMYGALSGKVTEAASKDVLLELVEQEKGHQEILERYLRGELDSGMMNRDQAIDYKIAEHFPPVEITDDIVIKDIFLLASNREKASNEFYLRLSELHPEGEVKRLLRQMASEELSHKQKMEKLYTETAFPQTAGG